MDYNLAIMNALKIVGIILIVIGIAVLATGSFHFKKKEKILDSDAIDINGTKQKLLPGQELLVL
jgi:hypothetical protein